MGVSVATQGSPVGETTDNADGVSVLWNAVDGSAWTFVYAPGAGSNLRDPFGQQLAERLPEAGVSLVRFQFPYQEAGLRRPDSPGMLLATWRAVLESLALFAYPLHPPGKPEQLRTAHLPGIACPALFCSGTRDTFAAPDELAVAAALVPQSRIHLLDGADHGFAVLKSSGRSREDVWAEAAGVLVEWLGGLRAAC